MSKDLFEQIKGLSDLVPVEKITKENNDNVDRTNEWKFYEVLDSFRANLKDFNSVEEAVSVLELIEVEERRLFVGYIYEEPFWTPGFPGEFPWRVSNWYMSRMSELYDKFKDDKSVSLERLKAFGLKIYKERDHIIKNGGEWEGSREFWILLEV